MPPRDIFLLHEKEKTGPRTSRKTDKWRKRRKMRMMVASLIRMVPLRLHEDDLRGEHEPRKEKAKRRCSTIGLQVQE